MKTQARGVAAGARDDHVVSSRIRAQLPQRTRGANQGRVSPQASVAAIQRQAGLRTESAGRVDARVDGVEPTGGDPPANRARAESRGKQLRAHDDAVLVPRKFGDQALVRPSAYMRPGMRARCSAQGAQRPGWRRPARVAREMCRRCGTASLHPRPFVRAQDRAHAAQ